MTPATSWAAENAPVMVALDHPRSRSIGVMKTANAYDRMPYDTVAVTPSVATMAHP